MQKKVQKKKQTAALDKPAKTLSTHYAARQAARHAAFTAWTSFQLWLICCSLAMILIGFSLILKLEIAAGIKMSQVIFAILPAVAAAFILLLIAKFFSFFCCLCPLTFFF